MVLTRLVLLDRTFRDNTEWMSLRKLLVVRPTMDREVRFTLFLRAAAADLVEAKKSLDEALALISDEGGPLPPAIERQRQNFERVAAAIEQALSDAEAEPH